MLDKFFGKKENEKKDTVLEFKDGSEIDFDIFLVTTRIGIPTSTR